MYYTPYSLQPSYWEFKRMCELNELPNNKEKYNKILSYFDLSLDTLDWEELNKEKAMTQQALEFYYLNFRDKDFYNRNTPLYSYYVPIPLKYKKFDDTIKVFFKHKIDRNNIDEMILDLTWNTHRIDGVNWNISTDGRFWVSVKKLYCFPKGKYNRR
ncbi:hypothetical protein [Helicobacter sp. MIT 14-3879]|uniref:hypothetical protein n=1 Tax=Helicobacter sp. MIT 14-3879 TaxID=2040649 RepID=UPI002162349F|nr:hypothetical protein [Helicobacter sp. MIT 14-3879]